MQNGAVMPDSWHLLREVRRDYNARWIPHADLHNPGVLRADILKVCILYWPRTALEERTLIPRFRAFVTSTRICGNIRILPMINSNPMTENWTSCLGPILATAPLRYRPRSISSIPNREAPGKSGGGAIYK